MDPRAPGTPTWPQRLPPTHDLPADDDPRRYMQPYVGFNTCGGRCVLQIWRGSRRWGLLVGSVAKTVRVDSLAMIVTIVFALNCAGRSERGFLEQDEAFRLAGVVTCCEWAGRVVLYVRKSMWDVELACIPV